MLSWPFCTPGEPQFGNINMGTRRVVVVAFTKRPSAGSCYFDLWVQSHLNKMNDFGFWGENLYQRTQFQNGYHQY